MDKKNPYNVKMSAAELQQYLHFRKRGFKVPAKKGKGSFKRDKKVDFAY